MFFSTELVPGTGPAKKNRQPWSHGPAPPEYCGNPSPPDKGPARRADATSTSPISVTLSPPDLVQCPDRQCAQSRWASDVGSNDHIIGPAWLSALRVGALYGRWLRMVLIGPFTCWIANCPCKNVHVHAAKASPWKCHWRPATPDCPMQPLDMYDQSDRDWPRRCRARLPRRKTSWAFGLGTWVVGIFSRGWSVGLGLSNVFVGAGPWDHLCRNESGYFRNIRKMF